VETAWLLLQECGDNPTDAQTRNAVTAMREQGWAIDQAYYLVAAASGWTGQVVHQCANCPCN
jgi:hypothetical protein